MLLYSMNIVAQCGLHPKPVISDYTYHDSSMIDGNDGCYYSFASCVVNRYSPDDFTNYYTVAIFRSTDLINWEFYKYALHPTHIGDKGKFPYVGNKGKIKYYQIWAPEIVRYKNKYKLYVALRNSYEDSKIALFESKSISSDFRFKSIVVSSEKQDKKAFVKSKEIIDPFPFEDCGKLYLVYGSFSRWLNGKSIEERKGIASYIVKLNRTGSKICAKPVFLTDYYEGNSIVKHNDRYYLFGTIGAWKNDSQVIHYAAADNVMGPYYTHLNLPINDTLSYNPVDKIINNMGVSNGFGCMTRPVRDRDSNLWVMVNGHYTILPPILSGSPSEERYSFLFKLLWNDENKPYLDCKNE